MNPKILDLWNEYKSLNSIKHDVFAVAEFGDSPELADRLAGLIDRGVKTATCSSYQDYLNENVALPEIGSYFMVVTSTNDPVCLCQVTGIRVASFNTVDAEFAFDEGEDDRRSTHGCGNIAASLGCRQPRHLPEKIRSWSFSNDFAGYGLISTVIKNDR